MANIQFNYLYRDGGNYKKHSSIIFANPTNISLTELLNLIQSKLIDGSWFYADQWGLPDLRWEIIDYEVDPTWHEFEIINHTNELPSADYSLEQLLTNVTNN